MLKITRRLEYTLISENEDEINNYVSKLKKRGFTLYEESGDGTVIIKQLDKTTFKESQQ